MRISAPVAIALNQFLQGPAGGKPGQVVSNVVDACFARRLQNQIMSDVLLRFMQRILWRPLFGLTCSLCDCEWAKVAGTRKARAVYRTVTVAATRASGLC